MKKCLVLMLFGLISMNNFATHIVGGEMTYKKLNGNNYQINLTVFRDCKNGVADFDTPAIITVFDVNGAVLFIKDLVLLTDTVAPLTGNVLNCQADTVTCISKGFYLDTLNLPPLLGGYTIAYQRCCRSATILNLVNPAGIGATYWTHIPGPEVALTNSSPVFTINPPFYVYRNILNVLDQSATDNDGDSLAYFFTTIFDGADLCCPIIAAGSVCNTICPGTASSPPYTGVTYSVLYSVMQPVGSLTPMSIHPTTGMISLTPTTIGDYAIGLGINEYRNHALIGTYYRDFHMKVVPCNTASVTPTGPSTVTTTGITETQEMGFQIFPNPADKIVTISLSNSFSDAYYTLADVSGRIVLRKKMEATTESFSVTEFSKGLYFLKIDSKDNKTSINKKLIIE